ncbi:SPOR domain-containing protein [Erythrobacter litoralis]|uniref:SPOR domain-containing protein n=1 Tax=Erythrobacter litoralis TaxID=39960 RepID=UPI0024357D08|nr:SPOR domain-containing protein [Erythrobacter litoralis]MDG6078043.1 SPOR domain-containing protein [Erythrobacter litoralis]
MTKTRNTRFVRLAVTTALATTALAGCTGKVAPTASASAAKAQVALEKGKGEKAVRHAEAAVLAAPRDAQTRVLLGNAYLEDGRFLSAATSFSDAIALGDTSPRTVISLALAQTGMGDSRSAVETLERWEAAIDPADFGLAIALAGEPQRGVHILSNAIRGGENTAKTRQNLAYAYAMAGQWREARLMASQDVPAGELGTRMAEWGALANPANSRVRVAHLLGVEMQNDAGQPSMLALSNNPSIDQLATEAFAASDTSAEASAFAMASELPALDSDAAAPADLGEVAYAEGPEAAPGRMVGGTRFVSREVVQPLPDTAKRAPAPRRTANATTPRNAKPSPVPQIALGTGDYNIQLGSYFSMSDAQAAWSKFQRNYPELGNAKRSITKARVGGKIYYRVAATGFAKHSARAMCSTVKGKGGGCIAYAASNPLPGALSNGNIRVAAR